MHSVRNARSGPGHYKPKETHSVLHRDEQIYAYDLDELMEMFRATQKILEEMGFQEIHEDFSEHWETLPFKNGVEGWQWKDPYTAIVLDFTMRLKEPRTDRKTSEDVYKVKLSVKTELVKTLYPHWEWFDESTILKRSWFYKLVRKLTDNALFGKEEERYKEEAEELGIEFASRIREIQGSLPAIGKSKREYYNPNAPGGGT